MRHAHVREVASHKLVDGEDVSHTDEECRFLFRIEIIELINVKVNLGIRNLNYCLLSVTPTNPT